MCCLTSSDSGRNRDPCSLSEQYKRGEVKRPGFLLRELMDDHFQWLTPTCIDHGGDEALQHALTASCALCASLSVCVTLKKMKKSASAERYYYGLDSLLTALYRQQAPFFYLCFTDSHHIQGEQSRDDSGLSMNMQEWQLFVLHFSTFIDSLPTHTQRQSGDSPAQCAAINGHKSELQTDCTSNRNTITPVEQISSRQEEQTNEKPTNTLEERTLVPLLCLFLLLSSSFFHHWTQRNLTLCPSCWASSYIRWRPRSNTSPLLHIVAFYCFNRQKKWAKYLAVLYEAELVFFVAMSHNRACIYWSRECS